MSELNSVRTLDLKNSLKNANYGQVGKFNNLRKMVLETDSKGNVTLNIYSRKTDAPGQILKFDAADFHAFQEFIFPIVETFPVILAMNPVKRYSARNRKVGFDADGNLIIVTQRTGMSTRINWKTAVDWVLKNNVAETEEKDGAENG